MYDSIDLKNCGLPRQCAHKHAHTCTYMHVIHVHVGVAYTQEHGICGSYFQGSAPIRWSLLSGPGGMTIDESSGLVEWCHAFGLASVHTIRAQASNIIGRVDVTWTIEVPLSYSAQVSSTDPSGVIPSPHTISITGSIAFVPGASPRVVPIDVKVTSLATNRVNILSVLTTPLDFHTFFTTYYPRADDVGNFSVVRFCCIIYAYIEYVSLFNLEML